MDWLEPTTPFKQRDRRAFDFDTGSCDIRTVKVTLNDQDGVDVVPAPTEEPLKLDSVEKYKEWIRLCRPPSQGSYRPTLLLAMHKRLEDDPQCVKPVKSTSLPYGETDFTDICVSLYQHRSLAHIIRQRSTAVFTSGFVRWENAGDFSRSVVYHCKSDTESLPPGDDIVLSTTCFMDVPVILAVMYGCTDKIIKSTKKFLERCDRAAFHPLVLPMIFAELERKRLFDETDARANSLEARIRDLRERSNRKQSTESSKAKLQPGETSPETSTEPDKETTTKSDCDAIDLARSMRSLMNGLESFHEQLTLMQEHLQTLPTANSTSRPNLGTGQATIQGPKIYIEGRLQDMVSAFRSKVRSCETLVGTMTLVTQMELNYFTRRVAQINFHTATSTSEDGAQMKKISMLGAIFLPGSLVASIFSMSIFKWIPEDSNQTVAPWWLGLYFLISGILMSIAYVALKPPWVSSGDAIKKARENVYEQLDTEDDTKLFPRHDPPSPSDSSSTVPLERVTVSRQ